ncbi:methyltransferase [Streptomyces rubiginosohelvolus]|uniref:methyltransferase n=1 Tax=Streptomyces rubiginosohelvolus TaxID=67362 RepID=UPI0033BEF139
MTHDSPSPRSLPAMLLDDYLSLADDSCVAVLPHVLRITAELRIADLLGDDARTAADLSKDAGTDPDALHRLLRALVTVGVVAGEPGQRFRLTVTGARLRADAPGSVRASLLNTDSQRAWLRGADTLRTGLSVFDSALGGAFFDHKNADAEANTAFLDRMEERAGRLYPNLADVPDWSDCSVVMDLGGGNGYVLDRVLRAAPHLTGILFERPATVAAVGDSPRLRALGERCRVAEGDFFDRIPTDADTHLMCSVLHDWTDEETVRILRNSRAALRPGGRLLIVEMLVPQDGRWHPGVWSDIGMMVLTGGRERTAEEFTTLLRQAGFSAASTTAVPDSPFSVLEAK